MNTTIDTILSHRSVRKFKDNPLDEVQVQKIVECAQAASTSSSIQAYSIIGVTDPDKKKSLASIAGNQLYVEQNGHFFVFCADLYRHQLIAREAGIDITTSMESTEMFMVSLIDASLAAQNAAIAAESMGLGICYIGGIRNDLEAVQRCLEIPERVIPLFGMAVGYPAEETEKKPRLPLKHLYHENHYDQNLEHFRAGIDKYDAIISQYYQVRTNGKRTHGWSEYIVNLLHLPKRTYMKEFLSKIGFPLK